MCDGSHQATYNVVFYLHGGDRGYIGVCQRKPLDTLDLVIAEGESHDEMETFSSKGLDPKAVQDLSDFEETFVWERKIFLLSESLREAKSWVIRLEIKNKTNASEKFNLNSKLSK